MTLNNPIYFLSTICNTMRHPLNNKPGPPIMECDVRIATFRGMVAISPPKRVLVVPPPPQPPFLAPPPSSVGSPPRCVVLLQQGAAPLSATIIVLRLSSMICCSSVLYVVLAVSVSSTNFLNCSCSREGGGLA